MRVFFLEERPNVKYRYPNTGVSNLFEQLNEIIMAIFTAELAIRALCVGGALWKDIDKEFLLDDTALDTGALGEQLSKMWYSGSMHLCLRTKGVPPLILIQDHDLISSLEPRKSAFLHKRNYRECVSPLHSHSGSSIHFRQNVCPP